VKRLAATAVVVVLLFAVRVGAGPLESGFLARIAATLALIERTLRQTNEVVSATRDRLAEVYPDNALRPIERLFERARSIKDEVEALSCSWQFSLRVQRLWQGLFQGARLCKAEWRALFGAPPRYVLQDLDEYFDYSATRRLNMVATRVERGRPQQEFLEWLLTEAERGRDPGEGGKFSPGYSQRLSALGAAALGNVLLEEGDTLTAELELAQEQVNDRRYRKRLETELALDVYAQLAGKAPGSGEARP
jgi:hypothetical protein